MHNDYKVLAAFSREELEEKVMELEEENYTQIGGVSEIQCRITGRTTWLQAMISKTPV